MEQRRKASSMRIGTNRSQNPMVFCLNIHGAGMKVGDLVRYVRRGKAIGLDMNVIGLVINVGSDPLRNNRSSAWVQWLNDSWSVEAQAILEVLP